MPFASFVRYMADQPPGERNQHWDQQVLVLQQPKFRLAGAYKIEHELDKGIRTIAEALEFDPDWAVTQLSRKANVSSRYDGSAHPMTDEVAEEVFHACEPDFDVFGYDKESYRELW